jgi:hypothetical protein
MVGAQARPYRAAVSLALAAVAAILPLRIVAGRSCPPLAERITTVVTMETIMRTEIFIVILYSWYT